PMLRPSHEAVTAAFEVLIEGQRPGGGQRCPGQGLQQADPVGGTYRAETIAYRRGHEDHEHDPRLRERDEVDHATPRGWMRAQDRRRGDTTSGLDTQVHAPIVRAPASPIRSPCARGIDSPDEGSA